MASLWRSPMAAWAIVCIIICLIPATRPATVNGGWTEWSELAGPCSKSCALGEQQKVRTCTNPAPQNGGLACLDSNNVAATTETAMHACNNFSCWSLDPKYLPWSNCSKVCGMGTRTRAPDCSEVGVCGSPEPPDEVGECNTWNRTTCPNPCDDVQCQQYAICEDISDDVNPKTKCKCLDSYKQRDNGDCYRPPPTPPTPRPNPTLAAETKVIATVISKTASSVLIFFVTLTLLLFLILRIFSIDRFIQMNMEIALLSAHLVLLLPPSLSETQAVCKIISILLHYLILACFMFMMLEAVHMYTLVAFVVKKDGLFSRMLNLLIGWGVPAAIVGISVAFQWENYGGEYHCWLQMNKPVMIAQQLPIIVLMLMTFTLIEAAGAAEYKPLKGVSKKQRISAKFSQRTNLLIVPMVYAHWLLGTLSEYQQNMYLYSIFSIVNGCLGVMVFFFHCSNNQQVRERLHQGIKKVREGS